MKLRYHLASWMFSQGDRFVLISLGFVHFIPPGLQPGVEATSGQLKPSKRFRIFRKTRHRAEALCE